MAVGLRALPGRTAFLASVGLAYLLVLAPLIAVFWVSFFRNKIIAFPPQGYTLAWFANAWSLDDFRNGFVLSLEIGVVATIGSLLIGVPAALALARHDFRGREAISAALMSPLIVPGIVAGTAVYMFYIEIERWTDVQLAATLPGLCLAHVVLALPWTVRLVTASLVGVNRLVEEAAMTLGAGPALTLWRVTLPMIRPAIVAGGLFSFVVSFVDLEKSLFLVGPGRMTLPIAIINYLEWSIDPTIAAVATIQIVIISAALLLTDRFVKLSRVF